MTTGVTEGALVSRGFAAQRSRARALPLLNLKKKRDCSQSKRMILLLIIMTTTMMMKMTMMNFIIWKKILYFNIYLHYLQKYNLYELKL